MASRTRTGAGVFGESMRFFLYSPPHGIFRNSAVIIMLIKLPDLAASWHVSFHSGCNDSVEKDIPRLSSQDFGSNKEKPFLPHQLTPYGTSTPATSLPTCRTQWISSPLGVHSVTGPSVWEWGRGGGSRSHKARQRHSEGTEVHTEGPAREERHSKWGGRGREGARDQLDRDVKTFSQTREKAGRDETGERRARRRKKRGGRKTERLSLGVLFPLICLKVTDTLPVLNRVLSFNT